MSVRVLKLRPKDVKRCAELEAQLFPGDDPWSETAFHAELGMGHHYVGAYTEEQRLVGYGGLALVAGPPLAEAEVHTVAVDPDWQGKGIGRALMDNLLAHADGRRAEVFLEVRTDNQPAITLYEKLGFEIVGLRKRYYQPSGADAFTMRRPRVAQSGGRTA
ncbi:ribosomal-protein-alanine N-acetyltransferase [Crossiella equi]|uniref:Ribosomal-protein-alanine N-acetyltransferase n=1 Tax=Crossiella equi TaxID=130796 RepID=A0ABS5AJ19_9PSEU|nr:ribosomal protein S18-alanine N-acetyltransferase [Crossiella equi]MBP2476214.1 ribosomal-protein-alanine N-acetyltransferase [Crossiella equi]